MRAPWFRPATFTVMVVGALSSRSLRCPKPSPKTLINDGSDANSDCDCDPPDNGILDLLPDNDNLSTPAGFRVFAIAGLPASTGQQSNDLSLFLSVGFEPET